LNKVFLDTNIYVYLFEDGGPRGARALQIVSALSERGDSLIVSTLTLGELLVKPLKHGDQVLADRYRRFVHGPAVKLMSFDGSAAELFARIRNDREIKPPDAIHLASAGTEGCDLFVTNDSRLTRKIIPGIRFIVSMDQAPI
jgi:predicted nucleic acid-binding protein